MNKKNVLIVAVLSSLFLVLGACGDDDGSDDVETTATTDSYIAASQNYQSWSPLGDGEIMMGDSPHGNVVTYANDAAMDTIADESYPFPEGAILVKEGYGDATSGDPAVLNIMGKESDGEWYWIQTNTDWELHNGVQGDVEMCTSCHGAASGTDGVFVDAYDIQPAE